MPTVRETIVPGLAHCSNARCEQGQVQQPVDVVHQLVEHTYLDSGGDLPHTQNSHTYFRFADASDAVCEHCGGPRECGVEERPKYQNYSRQRQDGLLRLIEEGLVGQPLQPAAENERIAGLERELASMRELLEKANKPARRPAAAAPPDEAA